MSKNILHNEPVWVAALQKGDREAFTVLYRHYSPQLYSGILRIVKDPLTAEEIIQDLFTKVWLKREMPGLQENFAGYIYRIGQRLVFDFFRKLKSDQQLLQKFKQHSARHYNPVEELLQEKECSLLLHKAIDQLTPQQKKVYKLVKQEGYTYKKASEIMGISPLTVKEYLVTGKKNLQQYMLNNMDTSVVIAWLLLQIDIL